MGGTVDLGWGMAPRSVVMAAAVVALTVAGGAVAWAPGGVATSTLVSTALVVAAGFFLAAGTYRLAKWRMLRDPHSGLVGSALMVMGALALPSRLLVNLVAEVDSIVVGPASRGIASFIAMALVLRALRTSELGPHETPAWVLPTAFAVCAGTFVSALTIELYLGPGVPTADAHVAIVLLIALGWAVVAVATGRRADRLAWAGRVSPLLGGMAVAETLRAVGVGEPNTWTLAGVLLTAVLGAMATRAAMADLDRATEASRFKQQHLYEQLGVVAGDVEAHDRWRSEVRHDAVNTCAGLRAAMSLLYAPGSELRPEVVEQLRAAAVNELQQLEDLLASDTTDVAELDLAGALDTAIAPVLLLGATITVTAPPACVLGDRADLVLVVRELLVRSFSDTPANEVGLSVHPGPATTLIRYTETRPVASRAGSEAELRAVRHLLRRHGGDLRLGGGPEGGLLELTMPSAPLRTAVPAPAWDLLVKDPA